MKYNVAPRTGDESGCNQCTGEPVGIGKLRNYAADEFLQHVTTDTSTGIEDCHNEQCFEHDTEVIPVVHEVIKTGNAGEDECHADCQGNGTARTMSNVFTDHMAELRQINYRHVECCKVFSCRVDCKIVVRN